MIVCDEIPRHKKKAPRCKPFTVEYFVPRQTGGWLKYRSYTTLAKARQAAEDLKRSYAIIHWAFRVRE